MPTFEQAFTIKAPVEEVVFSHSDTSARKKINPPLVYVQLHRVDPLDEGSISEFT